VAENETFYVGVDPIVPRANESDQPLNTPAEVKKLEDLGLIDKMPAEDEELDGDVEDDSTPGPDNGFAPEPEVEPTVEPEAEPVVEPENSADKNNDGLLDPPTL
jgi:hypothetical protein